MKRYQKWLFPSIVVLAFSAAHPHTAQSQRLENREANQERRMGGIPFGEEGLKEQGTGTEGKEKQGQKTNKEGNRIGTKIERERSAVSRAPGALNNNSVPTDPNEVRK